MKTLILLILTGWLSWGAVNAYSFEMIINNPSTNTAVEINADPGLTPSSTVYITSAPNPDGSTTTMGF